MPRKDETAKKRVGRITAQRNGIPFLDRERESRCIEAALRKNESMVISGPADVGKTALILNVMRNLRGDLAGKCLYVAGFKNLRDLLRKLLKSLYRTGNPALRRQVRKEGFSAAGFESWLKGMPGSRLKGTLYRTIEGGVCHVVLDHPPPLTHAIGKVIKELFWMRNTPVFLLAGNDQKLRMAQFAEFSYWSDCQCLTLGPLPAPWAGELLETCIGKFGLARFDRKGFREEVLDLSHCVPGAIVKMCALAADPKYQCGSRVKMRLAYIDYLMEGSGTYPSSGGGLKRSGNGSL